MKKGYYKSLNNCLYFIDSNGSYYKICKLGRKFDNPELLEN